MSKNSNKVTHQALLGVAESEYKYLLESSTHDGFDLSEMETLDDTEEELEITFSLTLSEKTLHFKYSLGFDSDEGGYLPFLEVDSAVGGDEDIENFSTKQVGLQRYVKTNDDLLEAIEQLSLNCGEARFIAFQWLERQVTQKPVGMHPA